MIRRIDMGVPCHIMQFLYNYIYKGVTEMKVQPTKTYPNGDLLYVAPEGKMLLQVETGRKYKKAFEPHDGKHYTYEEADDEGAY